MTAQIVDETTRAPLSAAAKSFLVWYRNDGDETAMRKTVVPLLESPDDLVRGVVPKWLYQIPAPTPAEADAVRAMCVRRGCADVLTVLGVAS